MNIREVVLKYVVINASKYGRADFKAVMGKVMSEVPELRSKAKEVVDIVQEVIKEFDSLPEEKKLELFEQYKEEKKERKKEIALPPLQSAEKGRVVMRFAPNPNGPPTLGSARGMIVNGEYARMYDGRLILRFDDTDPRTKRPMVEAYEWYLEDFEWLGYEPDETLYASKRIPIYYDYIKKLIEMEKAYACFCSREEFKKHRDSGTECPHRGLPAEDTMDVWEKMLAGEYREGEVVIRIKTDMQHKDPAIRDWVAFRIIYEEHPLTGDEYFVYPTLDFESAIEDHLNGITHIIRGKDLIDSERRQKYIYRYFGWEYPMTKHWGRVKIHEFGKLSTSSIKKAIEEGKFTGWDDPKLPTLRALKRRGFSPEAIKKFFISLGVSENDVSVSMKNLYAENRKIIDETANRYFFVENPVLIEIKGLEFDGEVDVPLSPKGGVRKLKGESRVYISSSDFNRFGDGEIFRLKDFCNVRVVSKEELIFEFADFELKNVKKGKNIIQWVPESQAVDCEVLGLERNYTGKAEINAVNDVGKVVQFERFAFCRIESFDGKLLAVFTHP
ncbi:glutamyl-tRNA synthetase [Archaeoglobus sulfaticallidus PM70-1]|uniref:Glutamate--tRNA ligase n=1 Tax=Archaeoglobus sulfaticallidus PM70-1 TaxID=387631 RepID=N0BAD8_9EURY|nr:glutamate--tRNA ligase [Archaeoglobus sulfaticallidus]AGK60554.1 glutamyl-tRNA synthetase [Archaeoglobus sulfaticallidus PM70-1]